MRLRELDEQALVERFPRDVEVVRGILLLDVEHRLDAVADGGGVQRLRLNDSSVGVFAASDTEPSSWDCEGGPEESIDRLDQRAAPDVEIDPLERLRY